jgi:CMP-N,N'-diacetyllegionaminic acid synthase
VSVIAIIPARAGSRRILGKNLRPLCGAPLLEWTTAAAKQAKRLDQIVVTSEDSAILRHAERVCGVEILARPESIARAETPDLPVAAHVVRTLKLRPEDLIVWLRPTAPFRTGADIDAVVALLARCPEASSVRSVRPAPPHPRKLYVDAGFEFLGYRALRPYTAQHAANAPSQGLEAVYEPVGFVDAVRVEWIQRGHFEGPLIAAWEAPATRSEVELDTPEDWAKAALLARTYDWRPGEVTA